MHAILCSFGIASNGALRNRDAGQLTCRTDLGTAASHSPGRSSHFLCSGSRRSSICYRPG